MCVGKNQPLANIMRGSIETNTEAAKDSTRKPSETVDAKDSTAAAAAIPRGQSLSCDKSVTSPVKPR